ncbi:MAG TPA: DUF4349 domain-containing protein [Micromonosporaceae bacterium]
MRTRSHRRLVGAALAGAVAVTLLAGCGASSDSRSSGSKAAAAPDSAQRREQSGAGAPAVKPGQDPAQNAPVTRAVAYTGTITVRVDDVDGAADRIAALAGGSGGYISAETRDSDAGKSTATITVKVPPDKFADVLGAIGGLGKEEQRQVSSEDLTAQVVDVQARLAAQRASVERIRALLAKATSISEITSIESELARREADLESLEARQRALTDQTSLSTITVTLLGPVAVVPATPKRKLGFWTGLETGWHGFTAALTALLTLLGFLLPFLVTIGVPVLVVLWALRRVRDRRTAPSAAAAAPRGAASPPSA